MDQDVSMEPPVASVISNPLDMDWDPTKSKICRLCLSTTGELLDVFNTATIGKIYICTSVLMTAATDVISAICSICYEKLCDFSNFRQQCIGSENLLQVALRKIALAAVRNIDKKSNSSYRKEEILISEPNTKDENKSILIEHTIPSSYQSESLNNNHAMDYTMSNNLQETNNEEHDYGNSSVNNTTFDVNVKMELVWSDKEDENEITQPIVVDKAKQIESTKTFICNVCGKDLQRYTDLKRHTKEGHKEFIEEILKSDSNAWNKYIIDVEGTERWKCPICPKITVASRESLKKHLNLHIKKCMICKISFSNSTTLKSHIHTVHSTRYNLNKISPECRTCKKKLKSTTNLNFHLRTKHDDILKIVQAKGVNELEKYKKIIDKGPKWQCPLCVSLLYSDTALKIHMYKHFDPQLFNCIKCQESGSTSRESFIEHIANNHKSFWEMSNPLYSCEYVKEKQVWTCKKCKKVFKNVLMFVKHVYDEADACGIGSGIIKFCEELNLFNFCMKQFANLDRKTIANPKKRTCRDCSKLFPTKNELNEHKCTNALPYKCTICREGFTREISLTRHKQTAHSVRDKTVSTQ